MQEAEKMKKEELSNYDLPKLHACQYVKRNIICHDVFQQFSTDFPECSHKALKEAYASSNKRDATLQILQYHTRK